MKFENATPDIMTDGKIDDKKMLDYLIRLETRVSESVNAIGSENMDTDSAKKLESAVSESAIKNSVTPQKNEIIGAMWNGIKNTDEVLACQTYNDKPIKYKWIEFENGPGQGNSVSAPHGLNLSSITIVGIECTASGGTYYSPFYFDRPLNGSSGNEISIGSTNVEIYASDSFNMSSYSFKICIKYIEN